MISGNECWKRNCKEWIIIIIIMTVCFIVDTLCYNCIMNWGGGNIVFILAHLE